MRDAVAAVASPKRGKKGATVATLRQGKLAKSASAEAPPPERQARLEQALRAWRLTEAKRRNMPAFRIFGDRTLRNIASTCPKTDSALLAVPGIGMGTVEKYGAQIYHLIASAESVNGRNPRNRIGWPVLGIPLRQNGLEWGTQRFLVRIRVFAGVRSVVTTHPEVSMLAYEPRAQPSISSTYLAKCWDAAVKLSWQLGTPHWTRTALNREQSPGQECRIKFKVESTSMDDVATAARG